MTDDGRFRYALTLLDMQGRSLGQTAVEADFETAIESVHFHGIRRSRIPPAGETSAAEISPVWDVTLGEPYASGFRVALGVNDGDPVAQQFGPVYFHDQAARGSARLVREGKLAKGDEYRYQLTAFHAEGDRSGGGARPQVRRAVALRPREGRLAERIDGSEPRGTGEPDDFPVFIPRRVLDEASALVRAAGDRETGGVLVGHLYRDASLPEVFAVVEAQIPARHAREAPASLTFTARTWAEIASIVSLRGREEIYLGWWHSHPISALACRNCPVERRRRCPLANEFLSADDRLLHRGVFPRAYSVALVVNAITPDEHTFSLFGWRGGLIQSRAFRVVPAARRSARDDGGPKAA